jgi:uncharacterized repeat protein (TIGR03806 family)
MTYHPPKRLLLAAGLVVSVCALSLSGCGGDTGEADPACDLTLPAGGEPFDTLSEYCFFQGDMAAHKPSEGVYAYDVNTKLYSDLSSKLRFIVLPEGETIGFHETKKWEFPVGATLVKTFYYPVDAREPSKGRKLLETRLLVRRQNGWHTEIYRWNDEQTEAAHYLVGKSIEVDWIDDTGEAVTSRYTIPAKSDCKSCHNHSDDIVPLGPRSRQLNGPYDFGDGPVNQIDHFAELELFDTKPAASGELPRLIDPKDDSQPIEMRGRTYLEGNCAHCHSQGGPARNSGLFLSIDETDPYHWGVCKPPVAAGGGSGGRLYDIVPGEPDKSIMIFRMKSMEPDVKMPELPLRSVDQFGVDVISEWITQMDGECAQQ